MLTEFVYMWPDGRQEVRYRRVSGDECDGMKEQVDHMRADQGDECPYSYREVPGTDEYTTATCPRCHAVQEDADGFGVLYCEACGYCKHPAATDGKCDLCGAVQPGCSE
jgi:hypothetical protein